MWVHSSSPPSKTTSQKPSINRIATKVNIVVRHNPDLTGYNFIQGFSPGPSTPKVRVESYYSANFSPKPAWNRKKLDREGARPWRPLLGSANAKNSRDEVQNVDIMWPRQNNKPYALNIHLWSSINLAASTHNTITCTWAASRDKSQWTIVSRPWEGSCVYNKYNVDLKAFFHTGPSHCDCRHVRGLPSNNSLHKSLRRETKIDWTQTNKDGGWNEIELSWFFSKLLQKICYM